MIAAIHGSAKAAIDARSNANNIVFNAGTSIANVLGGINGTSTVNPVYEFSYKLHRVAPNTVNVYARTGADGDQQTAGRGGIVVRSFDIPSRAMQSDRIEVYNDATYCVFEHLMWNRGDAIWIYTYERLRSDVNNGSVARWCLLKSTDGVRGRAFGSAAVQSITQYMLPLAILPDASGVNWIYFGQGSPAGLRRAPLAADGTIGTLSAPLFTASSMTEGSIVDVGGGTFIGVFRLNDGGYLQQSVSTDYGATWAALSSTGIGAPTGAKVTPEIMRCLNRPGRLLTTFDDRGDGNRERASSGNLIASALAGSWNAPVHIGGPATQGNGGCTGIDVDRREYLYVTAQVNASVTNMIWWTFRDNYSSYAVSPAAWQ